MGFNRTLTLNYWNHHIMWYGPYGFYYLIWYVVQKMPENIDWKPSDKMQKIICKIWIRRYRRKSSRLPSRILCNSRQNCNQIRIRSNHHHNHHDNLSYTFSSLNTKSLKLPGYTIGHTYRTIFHFCYKTHFILILFTLRSCYRNRSADNLYNANYPSLINISIEPFIMQQNFRLT